MMQIEKRNSGGVEIEPVKPGKPPASKITILPASGPLPCPSIVAARARSRKSPDTGTAAVDLVTIANTSHAPTRMDGAGPIGGDVHHHPASLSDLTEAVRTGDMTAGVALLKKLGMARAATKRTTAPRRGRSFAEFSRSIDRDFSFEPEIG